MKYINTDAMLKHLPKDVLKTIEKIHFYSKEPVYYNNVNIDKGNHNVAGISTTGLNAMQITTTKKKYAKYLNIDNQITKFKEMLKNE